MARLGRGFVNLPVTKAFARPYIIPSITLSLSTAGHLIINGKVVSIGAVTVATKVSFVITQAWNNALYASQSGVGFAVYAFNMGAQSMGTLRAQGSSETTSVAGLIEIATTAVGVNIGDTVVVVFWELAGGPASENIIGASFETLVAGP